MYLSYYGLKKHPFHITPDPEFLFLSPSHKEALGSFMYGIEKRKGFITITGEVGVGKTTILRTYLEGGHQVKEKTIYVLNPNISFHSLLTTIFRSLELVPVSDDVADMVNQLHEALIIEYQAGGTAVLIIDEAQNMPIETLENMRMLSNLETSKDKLIQVILIGQPELEDLLNQPRLRQLKQRLAIRGKIRPLTKQESIAYIEHRISQATKDGSPLFTGSAMSLIVKHGQGIPRRLNILCDNALTTGFGYQRNPVPASVVKEVIADIEGKAGFPVFLKWQYGAAIAIFLVAMTLWLLPSSKLKEITETPPAQSVQSFPDGKNVEKVESSSEVVEVERVVMNEDVEASMPYGLDPSQVSAQDKVQLYENLPAGDARALNVHTESINAQTASSEDTIRSVENSQQVFPIVREVQAGEILSQLSVEVYGFSSPKSLKWIMQHNPNIQNSDEILSGQTIVFPEFIPSQTQ